MVIPSFPKIYHIVHVDRLSSIINDEFIWSDCIISKIHLEADLKKTVSWAESNCKRWAFTLGNAGTYYFEDRNKLSQLGEINWDAVNSRNWKECKDEKQAEFLLEERFPFSLVDRIGVYSNNIKEQVKGLLGGNNKIPDVSVRKNWYY